MLQCQAQSYCKGRPHKCDIYCIGYVQMHNIYTLSNMPKKYQYGVALTAPDEDLDTFRALKAWQDNVEENIQQGKGLFLYSRTKGNGKTSWCCKIMNEYFRKVALANNLRCRGLYVNVPEFFQDLRNLMDMGTDEDRIRMRDLIENIKTADLVLWDDIGTESPTKWVREQLYIFINHREANGLSQFYTSNIPPEELVDEKMLGERIVSRILGQCDAYEFFSTVDKRVNR